LPTEMLDLESLEILKLHDNNLSDLPVNIKDLTQIRELYIDGNSFSDFPLIVTEINFLERLSITKNSLAFSIPVSISGLSSLKYLNIGWNNIDSIPSSFGELTNLESLYINNNNLASLPNSILNLVLIEGDDKECGCPANNFGMNKLCNVSEEIKTWLTRYDSDWENSQTCN
ncbi:leucine-rich repeat domain-containing protein, partial [Fibrobacterota bacterium]